MARSERPLEREAGSGKRKPENRWRGRRRRNPGIDVDRWWGREVRDSQADWSAGRNRLPGLWQLPDDRILGLERAGVTRDASDAQAELLDHRSRFTDTAAIEIRHLHRRRAFAQHDVDAAGQLELGAGGWVGRDYQTARRIRELLADIAHRESGILDCDARLLLRHVSRHRHFGSLLSRAQRENYSSAALLSAARGRIFLDDNVRRNCFVKARFTLLCRETGLLQNRRSILESLSNDVRQNAIVGKNLRRKCKEKNRGVGEKKSAGRGDQIRERTSGRRAPVHLTDPAQPRRERSISTVSLWQHAETTAVEQLGSNRPIRRRLEDEIEILRQEPIDLSVVLFRLERARAVDQ